MPLSRPEDDFFAFHDDELAPPAKKPKKAHHHHHHHRHHGSVSRSISASKEPEVPADSGITLDEDEDEAIVPEHDSKPVKSDDTDNSDLIEMLGLAKDENVSEVHSAPVSVSKPLEVPKMDEEFLKNLDTQISEFTSNDRESGSEDGDFEEKELNKTISIDGQPIKVRSVTFQIKVTTRFALKDYSISVKASGKMTFKKVCNKVIGALYPKYITEPVQHPEKLVFYINELDLIVKQVLLLGSLASLFQKKISPSEDGKGFSFSTILTDEATAQGMKGLLSIQKEPEPTKEVKTERTILLKDKITSKTTEIVVDESASLRDLIGIFLVRMKYPDELTVRLYNGEKLIDKSDDTLISDCGLDSNMVSLDYTQEQLKELKEDADDTTEIPEIPEDDRSYFTVNLVGKDRKSYKVKVHSETIIQSLVDYYRSKASIEPQKSITLLFDDEKLNPGAKVGDTELEQDFMIDVIVK